MWRRGLLPISLRGPRGGKGQRAVSSQSHLDGPVGEGLPAPWRKLELLRREVTWSDKLTLVEEDPGPQIWPLV